MPPKKSSLAAKTNLKTGVQKPAIKPAVKKSGAKTRSAGIAVTKTGPAKKGSSSSIKGKAKEKDNGQESVALRVCLNVMCFHGNCACQEVTVP